MFERTSAKEAWQLPYEKWQFAFFTPETLDADVTYVRFIDTAGYLNQFYALDQTFDNRHSVGTWSKTVSAIFGNFNLAKRPPHYMVFCWDSLIDKKTYETRVFFSQPVWEMMKSSPGNDERTGKPIWFKTILFGLAPEGKVRVWFQYNPGDNIPVPVHKIETVSGDDLDTCQQMVPDWQSYNHSKRIQEFIKDKTYPYGEW